MARVKIAPILAEDVNSRFPSHCASLVVGIRYAATGTGWPVHDDFRIILAN
jgi:hypothetical protein